MNDLRMVYSAPSVKQALRVRQSIADSAAGLFQLTSIEDSDISGRRVLEQKNLKHLWWVLERVYELLGFRKELNAEVGCLDVFISE